MKPSKPELRDLLNRIASCRSNEDCARQKLQEALTSCLIDRNRLSLYLEVLEDVLHREARYKEVLDENQLKAVLQEGLAALKEDELVRLALNPLALINLHHCIFDINECAEAPSEYWIDVLYRAVCGQQRDQPIVRVAACSAQSDADITEAMGEVESNLAVLAEFTWHGEQCKLLANMNDARMFAAVPSDATHLVVGRDKLFRLAECKHQGLRLVEGISRPRIRRCIEAGDTIGFLMSNQTQERK